MDKQLHAFYANDKFGFFTDHVLIPDNKRGKMYKIELFGWKQQILYADNILVKKIRNIGVTELIAADIAYNLNFQKDFDMIYVCPNLVMAMDVKRKVFRHFSNIPDSLKVPLHAGQNKYSYETSTDNKIIFTDDNNLGISYSCNTLYMEEVDAMKDFHHTYNCMLICVKLGGKTIITTTPVGGHSHFNFMWTNQNMFDKLELSYQNSGMVTKKRKTLNDISRTAYTKIIKECAIS